MNATILGKIKGGLIVSCQALEHEPLHSSYIMQRMAVAAMRAGAAGIRANTVSDILKIREEVDLPVIGIIKKEYADSDIYITPSIEEIDALADIGTDIIAMDSTGRKRPGGLSLQELFSEARGKYPKQIFMADCSTLEEGLAAAEMGFDIIGTTLHGYTPYTQDAELPNYGLMAQLAAETGKPVIAEGGIWTPEQLARALQSGVWSAVVGTAITRPYEITKRFLAAITE